MMELELSLKVEDIIGNIVLPHFLGCYSVVISQLILCDVFEVIGRDNVHAQIVVFFNSAYTRMVSSSCGS